MPSFYTSISKIMVSAKCNLWAIDLTHSNEWLNSCVNVNNSKDVKNSLMFLSINVKH